MCVESNIKGWCQELMKTLGGPNYKGNAFVGI
jgi:hypothetical protein